MWIQWSRCWPSPSDLRLEEFRKELDPAHTCKKIRWLNICKFSYWLKLLQLTRIWRHRFAGILQDWSETAYSWSLERCESQDVPFPDSDAILWRWFWWISVPPFLLLFHCEIDNDFSRTIDRCSSSEYNHMKNARSERRKIRQNLQIILAQLKVHPIKNARQIELVTCEIEKVLQLHNFASVLFIIF